MKSTIKFILAFSFILISCNKENEKNKYSSILDKNTTVLLNSNYNKYLEKNNNFIQWIPSNKELILVDKIIDQTIKNGKFSFLKFPIKEKISKLYHRQYIPYLNSKKERIIEINAFCDYKEVLYIKDLRVKSFDWKKDYYQVSDGGMCFWHLIINLDKNNYESFSINGVA